MPVCKHGAHGAVIALSPSLVVGCGARAKHSVIEGTGANPVLPPPDTSLIADADRDGIAETRAVFLANLASPLGMAPVGVAIAKDGALLVTDDVGNTVWRVTRQP